MARVRVVSLPDTITQLLVAHGDGEPDALDRLVPLVYEDLKRLARAQLRRGQPQASLDTIALVHEAYLKLVDPSRVSFNDRGHFFAVSAIAMRQILVDRARRRCRRKRGGLARHQALDGVADASTGEAERVLEVDLALRKLAATDLRQVRVVECRFFAGLSETETAEALGTSVRTVQREWFKARAWLRREIRGKP